MSLSREDRHRLAASLGLSTVLQIPLAIVFFAATMLWYAAVTEEQPLASPAFDRSGITMLIVEHRPRAAVAAIHRTPRVVPAPKHQEAKARPHVLAAQPVVLAVARHAPAIARSSIAQRDATTAKRIVETARAGSDNTTTEPVVTTAVASPQPSPAAVAATVAMISAPQPAPQRGSDGPNGGWGQNFEKPMVADESALADLRAKYHFAAPIIVRVDENGKALKVVWPETVPNEARAEIEKRLVAMRYVPAECNGLRCTGTLQITF